MKKWTRAMMLALALLLLLSALSGCAGSKEAKVTSVYQTLGGLVHTYIDVEFEDGTTASVLLPDDDAIWSKARSSVGKNAKVKQSGDDWTFVGF